nr:hypothetical protein HmN_000988000 [Hymenolepis microstoma]
MSDSTTISCSALGRRAVSGLVGNYDKSSVETVKTDVKPNIGFRKGLDAPHTVTSVYVLVINIYTEQSSSTLAIEDILTVVVG